MYYGHEFQSKFHWRAEDQGIIHRYIKPASPHLNGKRADQPMRHLQARSVRRDG